MVRFASCFEKFPWLTDSLMIRDDGSELASTTVSSSLLKVVSGRHLPRAIRQYVLQPTVTDYTIEQL